MEKSKGTKPQKKASDVKIIKSPTFSQQCKNSPLAAVKKKLLDKSFIEKDLGEVKDNNEEKLQPRNKNTLSINTLTPNLRDKKRVPSPNSDTKLLKKGYWKRGPKPAYYGVPLPPKMMEYLMNKKFRIDSDDDDFELIAEI